jgi:uncharacterized protein
MVYLSESMIEIKLFENVNIKGYSFIEGFPGIGLVGPMAISYIIDKLSMKYIGFLESSLFPPLVSIHKNEPMPPIRIYGSEKDKIVTIFAEFAIPIELIQELSNAIYDFLKANGVSKIYSIGGMPAQDADETPFVIASSQAVMENAISVAGLKPISEGVATGVSALLLVRAAMEKVQDVCIMVPVGENIIDPTYAEVAIVSLNKLMSLNIDIADIDKEAKLVQAKIKELMNKHKETHDNYKKASEAVDVADPSMYA